ncbi:MAG: DUF952 domain-containing protein [bacterium]|nr:DUF952 domain-containing protein [bacterium]
MTDRIIYKILPEAQWEHAQVVGEFHGAGIDLEDGYIHFSTAEQLRETASKHFAGQVDLLLVAVSVESLKKLRPGALKYEPSRGGALFPHLYAAMPLEAAPWVKPLPWLHTGEHQFPDLEG